MFRKWSFAIHPSLSVKSWRPPTRFEFRQKYIFIFINFMKFYTKKHEKWQKTTLTQCKNAVVKNRYTEKPVKNHSKMAKITQKSRKIHKIFMFFKFFVKFSLLKLPIILKITKNGKNRQKCVKKVEKCDFGPRNRPPKPKNAKNVLLIPPYKHFWYIFKTKNAFVQNFHEISWKTRGRFHKKCALPFLVLFYTKTWKNTKSTKYFK